MSKDDFTPAEMDELFGESPKSGRQRKLLPYRLDRKALGKSDAPYLADPKDKAYVKLAKINHNPKRNSIKVLTVLKPRRIIPTVIKRKDDKVATKNKIQTNYMQTGAVCLLAGGAMLGAADLLGGGLRACSVAALLVACLFIMAMDYRK